MNPAPLRLARRLYTRNFFKILFFSSCIAAGIAFLFSVDNILTAIEHGIALRARELLAADVRISSNRPFHRKTREVLARTAGSQTRTTEIISFSSMLQPQTGTPFLASVKAIEPDYPFYGKLVVEPADYRNVLFSKNTCLIDPAMMRLHGIQIGDRVRLGGTELLVAGVALKEPDRGLTSFNLAPRIFVAKRILQSTSLLRTGSRIHYRMLLAAAPSPSPKAAAETLKKNLEIALADPYLNISAYGEAQPSVRRALERVSTFFVLVSLIALLVGAVGMSAGITLFLNAQLETVGILRAMGWTQTQIARIYHTLCLAIGLQGGLLGCAAGWLISAIGADTAHRLGYIRIPFENTFSVSAMAEGMTLACLLAVGINIGKVRSLAGLAPLHILRERTRVLPAAPWGTAATAIIGFVVIFLYTFHKSNSVVVARNFSFGLVGAGIALAILIAGGLQLFSLLTRGPAQRLPFAFRHGLLQLTRHRARSLTFLFTLSAGFSLIGALGLVHHSLSREILLGKAEDVPDLFLVDIQKSQMPNVRTLIKRHSHRPPLLSPLVRARLTHINGKPILRQDIEGMTVEERRQHRFLTREYNLTYKDVLNESETLVEGTFWEPGETTPQVSLERGFCDMTGLAMGDQLRFDIQGRSIDATVTSVRTIRWMSMNPNFFVVFPQAVLEDAPQNFVGSLRSRGETDSAVFQKELISAFPNISVIDLTRVLENIQRVLGVLLRALSAIAWFCVAIGLLTLAGTLGLGVRERREEAALLRALGARRREIILTDACEFVAIGTLTFLISVAISHALGAYISARMDITFTAAPGETALTTAAAVLLPLSVGLAVHWRAYQAGVLETLRREV